MGHSGWGTGPASFALPRWPRQEQVAHRPCRSPGNAPSTRGAWQRPSRGLSGLAARLTVQRVCPQSRVQPAVDPATSSAALENNPEWERGRPRKKEGRKLGSAGSVSTDDGVQRGFTCAGRFHTFAGEHEIIPTTLRTAAIGRISAPPGSPSAPSAHSRSTWGAGQPLVDLTHCKDLVSLHPALHTVRFIFKQNSPRGTGVSSVSF